MAGENVNKSRASIHEEFSAYDKPGWDEPGLAQRRGLAFESLVQDLFDACDMLARRSFHTVDNSSEQIDGAILIDGRHALLESKWVKEEGIAASDLFAFLGKVEGKFVGTIGVFISRNKLSSNFLNALRAGRRQSVLVIHGDDVDRIFRPDFPLAHYMKEHLKRVSLDNEPHYAAETFAREDTSVSAITDTQLEAQPKVGSDPRVKELLKRCTEEKAAENLVHEFARDLTEDQRIAAAKRIIDNIKGVVAAKVGVNGWQGRNIELFLAELIELLPKRETAADEAYFLEKLSIDFADVEVAQIVGQFAKRFQFLSLDHRNRVEERLEMQWRKKFYDYDAENRLAVPTDALWNSLKRETKKTLIRFFVDIILSDRRRSFPQYRLASKVVGASRSNNDDRSAVEVAFDEIVIETARRLVGSAVWTDPEVKTRLVRILSDTVASMRPYLDDFEQRIEGIAASALRQPQ